MDPVTAWLRTLLAPLVEGLSTCLLARIGLGTMLVLAGIHKLLDPAGWTIYVTDWLAPWLLVSPTLFMLLNGWLELLFGGLLLGNRLVAPAAAVAAVSLPATIAYLAVVAVTDGLFVDILVRDVGLAVLAWVVLLDALEAAPTEPKE
ncbi:MAG: DoxX family membrane protein [Halolamina sp.]|uniref:DoxX family membrane protein n=1 Tax=Halolamina sp. TaxID=1940283 RepID=UPI002FC3A0EF